MNERNVWGWVIGIVVVVVVIGGLWWWMSMPAQPAGQTSATTVATTTTPVNVGQVTIVDKGSSSIASIVAGLTNASQYASLFNSTGVGSTLGARGPYTVFISTDAGYNLIAPGTIANMTAAQKKRMVQYSIVSGRALDINATNSGSVTSLSGDALNFVVQKSGLVQVNSSFALQEYKASNGIVYVINQPLLPPVNAQH